MGITSLALTTHSVIKQLEYTQDVSLHELRFMARNLPGEFNVEDIGAMELSYIEPGHGSKG